MNDDILDLQRYLISAGFKTQRLPEGEILTGYNSSNGTYTAVHLLSEYQAAVYSPERLVNEESQALKILSGEFNSGNVYHVFLVPVYQELSEHFISLGHSGARIWFLVMNRGTLGVFRDIEPQLSSFAGLLRGYMSSRVEHQEKNYGNDSYSGGGFRENRGGLQELWGTVRQYVEPVTLILVLINCAVYIITAAHGNTEDPEYMYSRGAMTWNSVLEDHQFYRIIASMFLHFGIQHLGNNMISLLFLGSMLERIIGRWRFAVLYILSGIISGYVSCLSHRAEYMAGSTEISVSAGASGAIFGAVGGLVAVVVFAKLLHWGVYQDISASAMIFMALVSLFQGFTSSGVDNAAHVGGMISGIFITIIYVVTAYAVRNHRQRTDS